MYELHRPGIGTIEPNSPDFETALEAERDMQLLAFAFDQLAAAELSDAYLGLLRKLVKDSVLPQNDRATSPGRDAAFEIHIGAVCTASRFLPVAWEEPDVTCFLDGTKHGFAAKRLKNMRRLQQRVSKAVKQIGRSGLPGLIILDLGLAFNSDNRRTPQMPETVFLSEIGVKFRANWSRYHRQVQEIMAPAANVLGIIVHDYHVRQHGNDWQLAGTTIRVPAQARTAEQQRYFEKLSTLYTYGLPNQSDVSSRPIILP
jgi:hypothetical protein